MNPGSDGCAISIEYATDIFEAETIKRLGAMLHRLLLHAISSSPDTLLSDLPLISDEERALVTTGFNDTSVEYPTDETIVDLFIKQAEERPTATAVIEGDTELSYAELDAKSNRLARHLINLGAEPEAVIGVCLERSTDLIITLLAILKSGAAYLPIDPDYPEERSTFMLEDADAKILITSHSACNGLLEQLTSDCKIISLDDPDTQDAINAQTDGQVTQNERRSSLTPNSLAYIIYTSGSTGKPKGVMIEHHALANYIRWMDTKFGDHSRQIILHHTTISFDYSAEELWWSLAFGHSLVVTRAASGETNIIVDDVIENNITTIVTVPQLLKDVLLNPQAANATSLKRILCGGEKLPGQLATDVCYKLPHIELVNHYGPSEATINVTSYITTGTETIVPIGRPVANTQIYVVDEQLQPQPIGVAGELLIGGVQLARGYLNRPELTAEKFIPDPFSTTQGARLYRTGDLARWRADGTLEFLGRIDAQVKIRGMRVEPGEIEAALSTCDGISQAAVIARSGSDGDKKLVAYIVPDNATDEELPSVTNLFDLETIRNELKRSLPAHMVPAEFVGLAELPLTPSGKLNRKALPDIDGAVARAPYIAPQTETEILMCQIMRDVIAHDRQDLEQVGIDDNFFDIGGHSILAAQYASLLEAALEKPVPIRLIFEAPTVRIASKLLDSATPSPPKEAIEMLRENPNLAIEFDEVFGKGAASTILGKSV